MIIETINELELVTVLNRGEANNECIAIKVNQQVNTAQFGLLIGYRRNESLPAQPYRDSFLWFGEAILNAGDWLFVYTGGGEPKATLASDNSGYVVTVHWGRPKTIFANSNIVPILVRFNGISIPPLPSDSEQLSMPLTDPTHPPLLRSK